MNIDTITKRKVGGFGRRTPMFGKFRKLHFVGIGGSGMSGIAEILHNLGFSISGSDSTPSEVTDYLGRLGVKMYSTHAGSNIADCDVVIISSAVGENNQEVVQARELGIPVIKRAEMLGELMRLKFSIGVAGTHGKTTTTSMIGRIMQVADLRPTLIVGGIVSELGTGAALGDGDYLVAEADEYDRSFLAMFPTVAVVTNIEADHLDCYDGMEDLLDSFLTFMNRVPFYGSAVISADDDNLVELRQQVTRPHVTFGFSPEADYQALDLVLTENRSTFSVYFKESLLGELVLPMPGKYNASNALAAIATCSELEIPFKIIAEALAKFGGVGRRFEFVGETNDMLLFDDYAHHPSEVRATLEMARTAYSRRIVVVFQPHLFSRTQLLSAEFAEVLALADKCILTDIYPAREEPIPGVTSQLIADRAAKSGKGDFEYVGTKDKATPRVVELAEPNDLIITMGAGSITHIRQELLEGLKNR
ncbi:MAG: UDP-N-acetylmuramate--L-alanine ligase [bacterium]|nr:UDP-N-acetylmuramate--L-alanine ligase [bacterium]